MDHKLTRHTQVNKKCKDEKCRSYILWFIDGVQILKQKFPYDKNYEDGFNHRTWIGDAYILNGKIYQTRKSWKGCCADHSDEKVRKVSFPLSKKKLNELGVLPNVKITYK